MDVSSEAVRQQPGERAGGRSMKAEIIVGAKRIAGTREKRRRLFKLLAAIAVVFAVVDSLPDLVRYVKMETM